MIPTRHLLLGLAAGLGLAAAHPPVGIGLLALVVPALLVAALDTAAAQGRGVAGPAAVFGAVGYGLVLLWLVQPAGYVGWTLLTLVHVGWYVVLAVVVARMPVTPARPLLVGLAWVGVDALRSLVPLNGFAWGTLGAATVDLPWLATLARLAGEKAITLAVVVLSVAAWEALRPPLAAATDDTGRLRWDRLRDALPAGRTGAAWLGATALAVTLATIEPPAPTGRLDVLAVQPNGFEQFAGTSAELDAAIATSAVDLTIKAVGEGDPPDLTIWPESSIDRDPSRSSAMADALEAGGRVTGGRLLAGAILDGTEERTFRNVVLAVGEDGRPTGDYQKRRLVPFGEYVPWRSALDWFPPLAQVPRDGQSGGGPHRVAVDGVDVAVAICFETLFPDVVRENLRAGDTLAGLVVAATNDASFGRGGEGLQHLAQSQLRAVETGRWVVHAAVSGPSAFVDPDGDVHDVTELFTPTSIRRTVETTTGQTPFLATGDWLAPVSVVALLALAALGLRRRPRDRGAA